MARFNVDVFLDDLYVKTIYDIEADSQWEAEESALENLNIDVMGEENE